MLMLIQQFCPNRSSGNKHRFITMALFRNNICPERFDDHLGPDLTSPLYMQINMYVISVPRPHDVVYTQFEDMFDVPVFVSDFFLTYHHSVHCNYKDIDCSGFKDFQAKWLKWTMGITDQRCWARQGIAHLPVRGQAVCDQQVIFKLSRAYYSITPALQFCWLLGRSADCSTLPGSKPVFEINLKQCGLHTQTQLQGQIQILLFAWMLDRTVIPRRAGGWGPFCFWQEPQQKKQQCQEKVVDWGLHSALYSSSVLCDTACLFRENAHNRRHTQNPPLIVRVSTAFSYSSVSWFQSGGSSLLEQTLLHYKSCTDYGSDRQVIEDNRKITVVNIPIELTRRQCQQEVTQTAAKARLGIVNVWWSQSDWTVDL